MLYGDGEKQRLNVDDKRWKYETSNVSAHPFFVTNIDQEPEKLQRTPGHFGKNHSCVIKYNDLDRFRLLIRIESKKRHF